MRVCVLSSTNEPLMPCTQRRARILLKKEKAVPVGHDPFTIRLLTRETGDLQPLEVKIDPGSKTTGIVVARKGEKRGWCAVMALELNHRGDRIRQDLVKRRQLRQGRRARKCRYRQPRFNNRTRKEGWLPPSLQHRVETTVARVKRLCRNLPHTNTRLVTEQNRFDTQLMVDPECAGNAYQQGTLWGYEVREYLLEKWKRTCAYCDKKEVPLQIEHIVPKASGGSDRLSNLCLACETCNQRKGSQSIKAFLKKQPARLEKILSQAKKPLRDAAMMNATRYRLTESLKDLGLPVETATGGRTKFNRCTQHYAKAHWIDAACVGESGQAMDITEIKEVAIVTCKGRGSRQMTRPDAYGFPRTKAKSVKRVQGYQTGDRVRLIQPSGKYKGVHEGEVAIRATGMFDIVTQQGSPPKKVTITAPSKRFKCVRRFDGYTYARRAVGATSETVIP